MKWVVLGPTGEVLGRVYRCDQEQAARFTAVFWPELETATLRPWDHATNRQRDDAKAGVLVTPEIASTLMVTLLP